MNNNERLETILKIREERNNLANLNLKREEKEVLRKALNLYEEDLDIEIARFNKEIKTLEEEGITPTNTIINVPVEEISSKYQEYANIINLDVLSIINNLLTKIDNNPIIYKALKNYCLYLQDLELKKTNNLNNFLDQDLSIKK